MFWSVEVDELNLRDRAAEAAFGLVAALNGEDWQEGPSPEDHQRDEESALVMDWDEPVHELPPELAFIFEKVSKGERKLDLKELLDDLPRLGVCQPRHPRTTTEVTDTRRTTRFTRPGSRRFCIYFVSSVTCTSALKKERRKVP